jgi:nicotinic acid phosphoribosyltransferase
MSNVDQMIENVRIGRLTFANLRKDLEAAGFIVGEDYGINPETGRISYMSITYTDAYNCEKAEALVARLHAENASFGIGSLLRQAMRDTSNIAFKLHDFGYRSAGKRALSAPPATEHMVTLIENGELTDAAKKPLR